MQWLMQLITSFVGSLAFAVVFHVERKKLLYVGLGGLMAWGVYLLAGLAVSADAPRYFAAAVVITLYAEVLARVLKCPVTVFLVTSAIPLIPGSYLYATMRFFMQRDYAACTEAGLTTLLIAAAVAMGMIFPTAAFHVARRTAELLKKRTEAR